MEGASALEQNHRCTDFRVGGGRLKAAGETPALLCPSPRFGCGVKIRPMRGGKERPVSTGVFLRWRRFSRGLESPSRVDVIAEWEIAEKDEHHKESKAVEKGRIRT